MTAGNLIKGRWNLTVSLVLFVFAVLAATMLLGGIIVFIIHNAGLLRIADEDRDGDIKRFLFSMIGICVILGPALSGFFSRKALNPIRKVIESIHRVSEGDYKVKVDIKGISELKE